MREVPARGALRRSPRARRCQRARGSQPWRQSWIAPSPSNARERRGFTPGVLRLAGFELSEPRLELGQLRLRSLQQLLLHFEVLAQDEIEAGEPGGKHRLQVPLHILCRGVAQGFAYPLVQLIE